MKLMRVLKSFGRWMSFFVFHLSILLLLTSVGYVYMLAERDSIKEVLNDSGTYENFTNSFVETAARESQGVENSFPFDEPRVAEIIEFNFTPEVLRKQTEGVIDSTYDWLEGESEELSFEFNFAGQVDNTVNDVANYAVERYEQLPDCTSADKVNVTVFDLTCKPAGSNVLAIRDAAVADLQENELFVSIRSVDEDVLKDNNDSLYQRVAFLPDFYRLSRTIPFLIALLAVLSAVVFVLLHRQKRRGVIRLGRDTITTSLFILSMTVIFGYVIPRYTDWLAIEGEGLTALINNLINTFLQKLDDVIISASLFLGSIGVAILLLERMSRPENIYKEVKKKAGIKSSSKPKQAKSTYKKSSPPVQTSESKRKSTKKRKKNSKYRNINL